MWWMVLCFFAVFFMFNEATRDPSRSSELETTTQSSVVEDTQDTLGTRQLPAEGRAKSTRPLDETPPERSARVANWYESNPEYAPKNIRSRGPNLRPQKVAINANIPFKKEGWALASWYGPGFEGNPTAWGEIFNSMDATIVAHKTLPRGTKLRLTYPETGKSIIVRVRDRGPYWEDRELDLSQGAAVALGMIIAGVAWLQVERLS